MIVSGEVYRKYIYNKGEYTNLYIIFRVVNEKLIFEIREEINPGSDYKIDPVIYEHSF